MEILKQDDRAAELVDELKAYDDVSNGNPRPLRGVYNPLHAVFFNHFRVNFLDCVCGFSCLVVCLVLHAVIMPERLKSCLRDQ